MDTWNETVSRNASSEGVPWWRSIEDYIAYSPLKKESHIFMFFFSLPI